MAVASQSFLVMSRPCMALRGEDDDGEEDDCEEDDSDNDAQYV